MAQGGGGGERKRGWEGERERGEEERVGRWREGGRQRERREVRVGCRGNRWGRNYVVRDFV